jgi:cytidine deaminase
MTNTDYIDNETIINLQKLAIKMANYAYVPYSKFQVGAAILCDDNTMIGGCNVENLSYGLSNCGERTAIFKAISDGKIKFKALVIYSPQSQQYLSPCGACRQVLSEFVQSNFPIYLGDSSGNFIKVTFGELMPNAFNKAQFKG